MSLAASVTGCCKLQRIVNVCWLLDKPAWYPGQSTMTTVPTDPSRVGKRRIGTQSQTTKEATSKRRDRRTATAVSWYSRLLIVGMLSVAAGWEIFRWILAIITLD